MHVTVINHILKQPYKLIFFIRFQVIAQDEYNYESEEEDYEADGYGGDQPAAPYPNPLDEIGKGRRNRRGRRTGRIGRRKQMEFILNALAGGQ